jgi:predicted RNase H-like nuclease (RuvC/YqgF family)
MNIFKKWSAAAQPDVETFAVVANKRPSEIDAFETIAAPPPVGTVSDEVNPVLIEEKYTKQIQRLQRDTVALMESTQSTKSTVNNMVATTQQLWQKIESSEIENRTLAEQHDHLAIEAEKMLKKLEALEKHKQDLVAKMDRLQADNVEVEQLLTALEDQQRRFGLKN